MKDKRRLLYLLPVPQEFKVLLSVPLLRVIASVSSHCGESKLLLVIQYAGPLLDKHFNQ